MNPNLITYKKLVHTDILSLTELVNIYRDVFETENYLIPNPEKHLQDLLNKENIIFCVALLDSLVIGGLTAYLLPSVYYPSNQVYIYDFAVKQNRQRQGVGKGLIAFLKNFCIELGYKEIYVQAAFEDKHAIAFYRASGGQPEKVIHFTYDVVSMK